MDAILIAIVMVWNSDRHTLLQCLSEFHIWDETNVLNAVISSLNDGQTGSLQPSFNPNHGIHFDYHKARFAPRSLSGKVDMF